MSAGSWTTKPAVPEAEKRRRTSWPGSPGSIASSWPLAGRPDQTFFDVFDPEGVYLGVVVIPASILSEPAPHITGSRVYGITRDETTGVERVVLFAVRTPDLEEGLP